LSSVMASWGTRRVTMTLKVILPVSSIYTGEKTIIFQ
jgi:hypothetical protein